MKKYHTWTTKDLKRIDEHIDSEKFPQSKQAMERLAVEMGISFSSVQTHVRDRVRQRGGAWAIKNEKRIGRTR